MHRPSAWTALASDDDPLDLSERQPAEILQQRFYRKKAYSCRCSPKRSDAWKAVASVFDRNSEPDVLCLREPRPFRRPSGKPVGSLRQNLIGVLGCSAHDVEDIFQEGIPNELAEHVTHAVDEDLLRRAPTKRLLKTFWAELRIKSLVEGMRTPARHDRAAETLCERLRVAVFASRRDLHAPSYWVPGFVGPFDGSRHAPVLVLRSVYTRRPRPA